MPPWWRTLSSADPDAIIIRGPGQTDVIVLSDARAFAAEIDRAVRRIRQVWHHYGPYS